MTIKVKKFKYSEKQTKTEVVFFKVYLDENNNHDKQEEYTLSTSDKPLQILLDKLLSFNTYVKDICELSCNLESIMVTGITYSFSNDIMGCCLIAQHSLSKSTGIVNLVTPHRIEDYYGKDGDSGQLMPIGMNQDAKELEQLIINFVNGDRAKTRDMFEEQN